MERQTTRQRLAALIHRAARLPVTRRVAGLALAQAVCWPVAALAHPHMWIDARATFDVDAAGNLTAIEQRWMFDEMFSTYAMQGVKKQKGGAYPPDKLRAMADDWMQALGDPISHYFTRVTVDGESLKYAPPRDPAVQWDAKLQRLVLRFTLPLAKPVALAGKRADIDIYDPTYFVAYAFDAPGAIALASGAPSTCKPTYRPPRQLDYATMQQLAAIPPDPDSLPDELLAITKGLTHRVEVACAAS